MLMGTTFICVIDELGLCDSWTYLLSEVDIDPESQQEVPAPTSKHRRRRFSAIAEDFNYDNSSSSSSSEDSSDESHLNSENFSTADSETDQ